MILLCGLIGALKKRMSDASGRPYGLTLLRQIRPPGRFDSRVSIIGDRLTGMPFSKRTAIAIKSFIVRRSKGRVSTGRVHSPGWSRQEGVKPSAAAWRPIFRCVDAPVSRVGGSKSWHTAIFFAGMAEAIYRRRRRNQETGGKPSLKFTWAVASRALDGQHTVGGHYAHQAGGIEFLTTAIQARPGRRITEGRAAWFLRLMMMPFQYEARLSSHRASAIAARDTTPFLRRFHHIAYKGKHGGVEYHESGYRIAVGRRSFHRCRPRGIR